MKKLIYLILTFFILHSTLCIAQRQGQEKIDSLLKELPGAKEDTNKVVILSAISFAYYSTNPDKGLEYASKCLALAQKLNWKKGIGSAFNCFGVNYWVKSQYPKALEYYFNSLKIYEEIGYKMGIAGDFVNIAIIYSEQQNSGKALEYYFKGLKIYEEIGHKRGISASLINIGVIFKNQSNYPKALEYYFKVQKINEELGDKVIIANNMMNIGVIYSEQSNYPKALEYYFNALKISEDIGDKLGFSRNLSAIGKLYLNLSKDKNFAKINERNEFVGLTKEINIRNGINYLTQAAKIALDIDALNFLNSIYSNLSEGYAQLGNYKLAYEYNEKHWKLKDSIFSFENQKKFKNLESARELEKREAEIKIYQVNDKFQKSAIWGASGLVLIVIFFLYLVWRQRRKSEKLLLNILPAKIASRLKKKEHPIADQFDEASVVFIDIVDFTKSSSNSDPKRVAEVLNRLYSKLDTLAKKYGLEKIKTIGDCYMAASGIPIPDEENSIKAAAFATESMTMLKDYDTGDGTIINFRCGLDCGPVVAGVIGENKFIYDLWGDTVNTASRMESNGVEGKIQCTERFKEKVEQIPLNPPFSKGESAAGGLLPFSKGESSAGRFIPLSNVESSGLPSLEKGGQGGFSFEERGEIEIKGKGIMRTYFLERIND